MRDPLIVAAVVAGLVLLVAGIADLMLRGWRSRVRRQAGIPPLPPPPADLGEPLAEQRALYVATTPAGAPLERIAVAGLGFRAKATVTVATAGVVLDLAGEAPMFIAAGDIAGAGTARWAIDRGVGRDGLVVLRWRHAGREFDSYLREPGSRRILDALIRTAPTLEGETA